MRMPHRFEFLLVAIILIVALLSPRHLIAAVGPASPTPASAGYDIVADFAAERVRQDKETVCRALWTFSRDVLDKEFDPMRRRTGRYADWVYGWVSSVVTAYDIGWIAAKNTALRLDTGESPDLAAIQTRIEVYAQRRFQTLVVGDGGGLEMFARARQRLGERLVKLDRALASDRAAEIRALAARTSLDPAQLIADNAVPFLDLNSKGTTLASLNTGVLPQREADLLLFRSLRPLASRLAGSLLRTGAIDLGAGALLFQAYGYGGPLGFLVSAGALGAAVGSIDYTANLVSSFQGREALVRDLTKTLDEAQEKARRVLYRFVLIDGVMRGWALQCPEPFGELARVG
jgi:hypothetical protein